MRGVKSFFTLPTTILARGLCGGRCRRCNIVKNFLATHPTKIFLLKREAVPPSLSLCQFLPYFSGCLFPWVNSIMPSSQWSNLTAGPGRRSHYMHVCCNPISICLKADKLFLGRFQKLVCSKSILDTSNMPA